MSIFKTEVRGGKSVTYLIQMLSEIIVSHKLSVLSTVKSGQQEEQIVLSVGIQDKERDVREAKEAPEVMKFPHLRPANQQSVPAHVREMFH